MSKNKKEKISWKEKIENFFYSDNPGATATKFLLMFIALGGIAFVGAVIPGIAKLLDEFESENSKEKKYSKKQIDSALSGLKRNKFIKIIKEKDGIIKIRLTNKGKKRILKMSLDSIEIKKPNKWDGKWRIVIFDIPTKHNYAREALRRKIRDLGFRQLQKSVWIIPYECEDEILFVAEVFEVEKYIEIITASNLLHEKEIKKIFKI
jgi:DNA-binding PadR family transcriptional regulator